MIVCVCMMLDLPRQLGTVGLDVGDCDGVGASDVGALEAVGDADAVGASDGGDESDGASVTPGTVGASVGEAVGAVGAGVGEVGACVGGDVIHSPPQMMAQ